MSKCGLGIKCPDNWLSSEMAELDCLLIRQPYASLVAYGAKRWEFRTYDCKKRGLICIGSSRGKPFKTGDPLLNSISPLFPRGFALAVGVLVDSRQVVAEDLNRVYKGEKTIKIDGHKIVTVAEPLGEPKYDIQAAMKDRKWENYAWILQNVSPLRTIVQIRNNSSGSPWTKVSLEKGEPLSENIRNYF
jgi:hypothetical protein